MMGRILTETIVKNLIRLRCLHIGQKIRKDLQSNNSKVRHDAEKTVSTIIGAVVVLFALVLWPYFLAALIIYTIYKILHQKKEA